MKEINKIQQLNLDLISLVDRNDFHGECVVKDLIECKELWSGVIMDQPDLIHLRDLHEDDWNVDRMYILTSGVNDLKLMHIIEKWEADTIEILPDWEYDSLLGTSDIKNKVIKLWWD